MIAYEYQRTQPIVPPMAHVVILYFFRIAIGVRNGEKLCNPP